jgi:nucleoside-diphosphate-sugar epimerase
MVEDRWYTNSKAKELLSWRPEVSMEEGLSRQIEWAYENGHLERRN